MDNVPVHANESGGERRNMQEVRPVRIKKNRRKYGKFKTTIVSLAAVVIIAGLVLGGLFMYRASTGSTIDNSRYQAVFFTNGQVYFGKLQTLNGAYLKLTDIFYLQTKVATDSANPQSTTNSTANDVELVKLGNEIHGPEDAMVINKDQVLFFENLKNDSKVSQSIAKYKAN